MERGNENGNRNTYEELIRMITRLDIIDLNLKIINDLVNSPYLAQDDDYLTLINLIEQRVRDVLEQLPPNVDKLELSGVTVERAVEVPQEQGPLEWSDNHLLDYMDQLQQAITTLTDILSGKK